MSNRNTGPAMTASHLLTHPDLSPEAISNLRPFGKIIVARLKGIDPEGALDAALTQAFKAAKSKRRSSVEAIEDVRRSPTERVGKTLRAQSINWSERTRSVSYTDGRCKTSRPYIAVATDDEYLAVSTDSDSAASAVRKWIRSEQQGFVGPLSNLVYSSLAAGQPAVAAWLRNTNTGTAAQFTTMSVRGADVGESAQANDLLSYLAGTVRVERATAGQESEHVTVNPDKQQLSFKTTDSIGCWADLVEVAFFWINNATPSSGSLLTGTAEHVYSLVDVGYPYEVLLRVSSPGAAGLEEEDDDESHDHALRFDVAAGQDPANFKCLVWLDDTYAGEAQVRLRIDDDLWSCDFTFEYAAAPSHVEIVRSVVDSRGLEIHFASEHLYSGSHVSHRPKKPIHFRSYRWEDFSGFQISKEKPHTAATEMRKMIGTEGDRSLFGWVVQRFNKGWLVCDDGSNEVADFIHLTDEELILIPVKAAREGGMATSAGAIQTVQAQANKNLIFFDSEGIRGLHRTLKGRKQNLVAFRDGMRQENADEFLDELACIQPCERSYSVVIVQPQLERRQIARARSQIEGGRRRVNDLGLMRINAMLRTLDQRCADLGVQLDVIGREDVG